jgi:hypothetical protein
LKVERSTAVLPFGGFRSSGDRNLPQNFIIHNSTMKFYSVEYWQKNWEELISKVENGESIGITNGKHKAVMVPADEELIRIYTENNNEGS